MSKMSRHTAWAIRIVAVLASAGACYVLLGMLDSRSPWVIVAVVAAVGIVGGGLVARLTAPGAAGGDRRGPRSGSG